VNLIYKKKTHHTHAGTEAGERGWYTLICF